MKRALSFLLRRATPITSVDSDRPLTVYDPVTLGNRLNRYLKRRLSDDLEGLVHTAYLGGDLQTAEELFVVLQNKLQRDCQKYPRDRRVSDDLIRRIAAELEKRRAMKQPDAKPEIVDELQVVTVLPK